MRRKWLLAIPIVLIILYFAGPSPVSPVYSLNMPMVPDSPAGVEHYVLQNESAHRLKQNNEARIVWANDSMKQVTDYCIVYLHGFSASQEEGDPVHRNIAAGSGGNLVSP